MKHKSMKTRLLSFATLLAILLPMIAMTSYAAQYSFDFAFNGSTSTWWARGEKYNSTDSPATVNVTTGDFGIGQTKLRMDDMDRVPASSYISVNSYGSYRISYWGSIPGNVVYLEGQPTNQYVWACGGSFTP